jgi:hypothetical protein
MASQKVQILRRSTYIRTPRFSGFVRLANFNMNGGTFFFAIRIEFVGFEIFMR